MRARIPIAVVIAVTLVTPALTQSLPDEAGPSLGWKDSTSQQESITNPGGFGKSSNMQAIDPNRTDSTRKLDCRQQKDVRTERGGRVNKNMDCVR
jgi:hypothetical protein